MSTGAAGGDSELEDDAGYVCGLDAETAQKAQRELNEDARDRLNAVRALRTWIRQQPHLTSKTDTLTLLYMLRTAKFSQLRAREIVENNARMYATYPEWMRDVDTHSPGVVDVIESGSSLACARVCRYVIPLPKRDKNGSPVILFRLGAKKSNGQLMSLDDQTKATMIVLWYYGRDENAQVNGMVFICDMTGFGAKHLTSWKMDDLRKWKTNWQNAMPGRYKAFHYYNTGAVFETLMVMSKPFLTKKMQDRIRVHDTMESLYKHVDMDLLPTEYLPDDYSGHSAGSVATIVDHFKREIMDATFRLQLLDQTSSRSFDIDETKRPNYKTVNESFRKLNVD